MRCMLKRSGETIVRGLITSTCTWQLLTGGACVHACRGTCTLKSSPLNGVPLSEPNADGFVSGYIRARIPLTSASTPAVVDPSAPAAAPVSSGWPDHGFQTCLRCTAITRTALVQCAQRSQPMKRYRCCLRRGACRRQQALLHVPEFKSQRDRRRDALRCGDWERLLPAVQGGQQVQRVCVLRCDGGLPQC